MGGSACVAVFLGPGSESSEEQEGCHEYAEEVALAEEEMAPLAFNCPPNRFANAAAQWEPGGISAGTATAAVELRGGDEFKRSGQLLAEAVGAIEGAGGAVGAAPKSMGSSNTWARSAGSGGGALGGAVGVAVGAARVGGGAGVVAGSSGWTHPDTAVVVQGAGGRHGAETGARGCTSTFRFHSTKLDLEAFVNLMASMSLIPGRVI